MATKSVFYAHSNGKNKADWQLLGDHLRNTAAFAEKFGEQTTVASYAKIAALFHDIGKFSQKFQERLDGSPCRVDHATAGAQEIRKLLIAQSQPVLGTMLAYCIAGHHGGLPDYGSIIDTADGSTLQARLKRNLLDYSAYTGELDFAEYFPLPNPRIKPSTKSGAYSFSFLTRMIYSALVDADFLETETFMSQGGKLRGEYETINTLAEKMERFIAGFSQPVKPINIKRTETLNHCLALASHQPGWFSLTIPTGGGKTFSSLAFALNHARIHNMERIIYVIPYTTIIDQNASEFKRVLGEANILEHHSNFDWQRGEDADSPETADDKTNEIKGKLKLASENWDIPVVVTTNVQFFESLYSNRSSRCRKLHNISRSVIIFDEAQMLPREFMQPCLMAINELVRNYGASAIFCTATQPVIQQFLPADVKITELASDPQGLAEAYKRVNIVNLEKLSDEALTGRLNHQKQVLCIVNTRRHARGLFTGLDEVGRYHLSTTMCAAHRKQTVAKIRAGLKSGDVCRVVSTQIMEAGIDVDFPVGYRAFAGLDSIIQAAGRVNREMKADTGTLYIFEPDSEFVGRTPSYISQGAEVTRAILRTYKEDELTSLKAMQDYYLRLYDVLDPQEFDREGIIACFEKSGARAADFDFKKAASKFRLIADNTVPIIIPYEPDVYRLINALKISDNPGGFSRSLQPYTVNVYENEYLSLAGEGLIDTLCERFNVLNCMDRYDAETGLILAQASTGQAIYFDG